MKIQIHRTLTPDLAPAAGSLLEGELAIEMATSPPRLWVGVPTALDGSGRRVVVEGAPFDINDYLPLAGGSLLGALTLSGNPTAGLHAATKEYVDAIAATAGVGVFLPLLGGTMTGPLTLVSNPALPLEAATKQYVDNLFANISASDYLPLAGGTMVGPLMLGADPIQALEAATKSYVDQAVSGGGAGTFVPISGGNMTGLLYLSADPIANLGAATKQYVDNTLVTGGGAFLPLFGGTLTGDLIVNTQGLGTLGVEILAEPANNAGVKIRAWTLVSRGTGQPNANAFVIADGATERLRINPNGVIYSAGAITLPADPVSNLEAATKQYVDSSSLNQAEGDARYVALAGSTMSGFLTLSGAPTAGSHAATKDYVDLHLTQAEADALFLTQAEADALFLTQAEGDGLYVNIGGDVMSGTLTAPYFSSTGGNAGFAFSDRGNAASQWILYATGGSARLWTGVDKFEVDSGGHVNTYGYGVRYKGLAGNQNIMGFTWSGSFGQLWVDNIYCGDLATIAWVTSVIPSVAGYLPLTGGRIYLPGGNDPLEIMADGARYARIKYHVSGVRIWSGGVSIDGNYMIADESASAVRTIIGMDGTLTNYGNISTSGTVYGGGLVSSWDISALNSISAVNTVYTWNLNATGTVTGAAVNSTGNSSITGQITAGYMWSAGNIDSANAINATNSIWTGGTITGGSIAASFAITAGQGISAASTITAGGAISGYSVYSQTSIGAATNVNATYYTMSGITLITRDGAATNYFDAGGAWRIAINHLASYTYAQNNTFAWNNEVGTIIAHMQAYQFYLYNQEAYKPGGGPFVATSDIRTKRNVATYNTGLAAITQLRPVTYETNGLGGTPDDDRTYVGLVADDVEAIMPELVGTVMQRWEPPPPPDPSRSPTPLLESELVPVKTLDANALTYALVNAVKELTTRLAAVETALGIAA